MADKNLRPDKKIIASLIPAGSRVLDLGCGDGTLLKTLIAEKKASGMGIEKDPEALNICLSKGLSVLQVDLNEGLSKFEDGFFDFVILNMTLQVIDRPDRLVKEMVRVGKKAIVGFPNFGLWILRFGFLLSGRMPKSRTLPYEWYDTPNIRLMTIKDFRGLCKEVNVKIEKEIFIDDDGKLIAPFWVNLRAAEGVFLLGR